MLHKLSILFNYPIYFRYGYFILLLVSIISNYLFLNDNNVVLFYILSVVFLGIGYYNKSLLFLLFSSLLVVVIRFFLIPVPHPNLLSFLVYLFVYFLITFISAGLMTYVQIGKKESFEFIKTLANTVDSRDKYTMHHSENVAKYAFEIAQEMNLPRNVSHNIYIGGLLHDIGKIGLPEQILNKPGKLTDEEYRIIRTHSQKGFDILRPVTNFKHKGILDITLYHHERYDGKGYPEGLKGEEIPLAARIIAVADAFDAMNSKRVYRNELDLKYTLEEIRKNKGKQFDPQIADVFLSLLEGQEEIALNKLKKSRPHLSIE